VGQEVTDIRLLVDPARHRLISAKAHNVVVQSAPYQGSKGLVSGNDAFPRFAPRADIAAYVQRYVDAAAQYSSRKAGFIAQAAVKNDGKHGGALANLIADAQLAATKDAGAQISFMNPFGVRASLSRRRTEPDLWPDLCRPALRQHADDDDHERRPDQGHAGGGLRRHRGRAGALALGRFAYSYDRSQPIGAGSSA
jgi:hypothetical protein